MFRFDIQKNRIFSASGQIFRAEQPNPHAKQLVSWFQYMHALNAAFCGIRQKNDRSIFGDAKGRIMFWFHVIFIFHSLKEGYFSWETVWAVFSLYEKLFC